MKQELSTRPRLAVYIDAVHRRLADQGSRIATDPADFAFLGIFLPEVSRRFTPLLLFGRATPDEAEHFVPLPSDVELVELPYYRDLRQLSSVLRASVPTLATFWKQLGRVDILWVFGPHPLGVPVILLALLRRKRVVLGVRQDSVAYFRARLSGNRWTPAVVPILALDGAYRVLARRLKTVVTGPAIAQSYGGEGRRLLTMIESVVRAGDVATRPPNAEWSREIRLFTVGRLEQEKNPLLLVEALARLEHERPGRYRLTWVGGGPMAETIRQHAEALGIGDRIELAGWVPFGPALLNLYRESHAFVHVSFTEGVPKVLVEALASGLPIVATDVGGVRSILDDGQAGLLVPPADLDGLVAAIMRITDDGDLRERLSARALELARERTLEAQAARVADFIADD